MYKFKSITAALLMTAFFVPFLSSCKKGTDDPEVSLKSRKDRFTNTWTLTAYEKNGTSESLSGSTYTYTAFNNGTLTQTIEGSIFGFPTRTTRSGNWEFLNDDEDVKITIDNDAIIYNVQRLASKELWLKRIENSNTHIYYFEGL